MKCNGITQVTDAGVPVVEEPSLKYHPPQFQTFSQNRRKSFHRKGLWLACPRTFCAKTHLPPYYIYDVTVYRFKTYRQTDDNMV